MSDRDEDREIERYSSRDRSPDRQSASNGKPDRLSEDSSRLSGNGRKQPTTNSPSAGTLGQLDGREDTIETASVTATLVGVPRIDIHDFVFDHRLDVTHDQGETRYVALFDVENTTDQPLRWQAAQTKFIGTDDYTYQASRLSLDPAELGPGCHTRQVEIEPGRSARVVTLVEKLPPGTEIAEVVQTVSAGPQIGNERLVFSVA